MASGLQMVGWEGTCRRKPSKRRAREENVWVLCVPHAIEVLSDPRGVPSYLTIQIDHYECDNFQG